MKRIDKLSNFYFLNHEVITKYHKKLIFKSLVTLTSLILSVNIIYLTRAAELIVDTKKTVITKILSKTLKQDDKVDLTFTSNLVQALNIKVVYNNGSVFTYSTQGSTLHLENKNYSQNVFSPLLGYTPWYNHWYISSSFNMIMYYPVSQEMDKYLSANSINYMQLELNIPALLVTDLTFNIIVTFLLLLSTFLMVLFVVGKVRVSDLIAKAGNEAMLSSKNSQKFTEAMHHEVKTPLSVLLSSFDRMEVLLEDLWSNTENIGYILKRLEEEKEPVRLISKMVGLNFEIIYNILDKQKNNRAIRYSNGNYNLYALIQHSLEGLKWDTKIKYIYSIDPQLKLFSNEDKGLSNEDFTNIITNHIRNSLEANSNNIRIVMNKMKDGKISIYIADNGNGMDENVKNMIYLPNFSTKKELKNSDNQGIGMYLCKTLLNEVGGDERVKVSGIKGTVFELVFPITKHIDKK